MRSPARRLGEDLRPGRLRLDRGRPDARLRHRGDDGGGEAPPRAARPAEPLREDPGDEAGPAGDRGHDREGQVDQRHADLLARALRGGRRGLHPGAPAALSRTAATPRRSPRSRASSSRASTRRPTAGWTSSAATTTSRASSRSPTRSSPTGATRSSSRTSAGRSWPPRARRRSAASGPRPRRRTRPTATSSTSRS